LLLLGALVYLAGWQAIHHGFYVRVDITDIPVYQNYGEAMRHGFLPYRDFAVEYPPGALLAFLAPAYIGSSYATTFSWMMAALGLCVFVLFAACRPSLAGLAFVAVSPLLVGADLASRFDLWPTALMMLGLAALLRDRHALGWAGLAAGFAAKLFPAVLMPIAAVWTYRRGGWPALRRSLLAALLVVVVIFGPFLVLTPGGLWSSLWGQASRPLQIESLGATILMTFAHPIVFHSHGSFNLDHQGLIGALQTVAQIAALVGVWVGFARGPVEGRRLVRFAAAAVCAFIIFGKVLSPQYLIWLVPLVPLLRGRRGLFATILLLGALIDTQVWFPDRYFPYVYHAHLAWLVLLRNVMLVALFFVLSLPVHALLDSSAPARRFRTRRGLLRSAPRRLRPRVGQETP
jgi:hypothetical protein